MKLILDHLQQADDFDLVSDHGVVAAAIVLNLTDRAVMSHAGRGGEVSAEEYADYFDACFRQMNLHEIVSCTASLLEASGINLAQAASNARSILDLPLPHEPATGIFGQLKEMIANGPIRLRSGMHADLLSHTVETAGDHLMSYQISERAGLFRRESVIGVAHARIPAPGAGYQHDLVLADGVTLTPNLQARLANALADLKSHSCAAVKLARSGQVVVPLSPADLAGSSPGAAIRRDVVNPIMGSLGLGSAKVHELPSSLMFEAEKRRSSGTDFANSPPLQFTCRYAEDGLKRIYSMIKPTEFLAQLRQDQADLDVFSIENAGRSLVKGQALTDEARVVAQDLLRDIRAARADRDELESGPQL